MNIPVQAIPASVASGQAAAWFLSGKTAESWLAEMVLWDIDLTQVQVYSVASSATDPMPCGALVVTSRSPRKVRRALPYRLLGHRTYLPLDGELSVAVTDLEADALSTNKLVLVHRMMGVVLLDLEAACGIDQLLSPPDQRVVFWGRAHPGIVAPPGILSVVIDEPPTMQDLYGDAEDHVGSMSDDELPPTPSEEQARTLSGRVQDGAAGMINRLGNWVGESDHPDAGTGWTGRMWRWADSRMQEIERRRQKELDRLLHLLDENPEEGLKYALPLASLGASRGVAAPGWKLSSRNTDFRLGGLGGGGAADDWGASDRMRRQLHDRYRKIAAELLAAGNHRRAAYVYAELLADLPAAANVLVQGGFLREAAVLYKDRLKQPLEAAKILVDGGLLMEAIAIYEAHDRLLDAAALYERLDRIEEAASLYRKVAEKLIAENDRIAASAIYLTKLDDVDAALELLAGAWPDGPRAHACLAEQFRILGEFGRTEEALARLAYLREHSPRAQESFDQAMSADVAMETQVSMAITLLSSRDGCSRAELQRRLNLDHMAATDLIAHLESRNLAKVTASGKKILPVVSESSMHIRVTGLAKILVGVYKHYPEASVQRRAEALTVDLVGGWLPHASRDSSGKLVGILRSLYPADRQLIRDCDQYRRMHKPLPPPPPPADDLNLIEYDQFQLPTDVNWFRFEAYNRHLYALGYTGQDLIIRRMTWRGEHQEHRWEVGQVNYLSCSLLLNGSVGVVYVNCPQAKTLESTSLPDDAPFYGEIKVRQSWFSSEEHVLCACSVSAGNVWAVIRDSSGLVHANRYSNGGELRASDALPVDGGAAGVATIAGAADTVHFCLGTAVMSLRPGSEWLHQELPSPVRSMSRPFVPAGACTADLQNGVALLAANGKITTLAEDMEEPVAFLQPEAFCAIVSKTENRIYRFVSGKPVLGVKLPGLGEKPTRVFSTGSRNRFAVITASGSVRLFQIVSDD